MRFLHPDQIAFWYKRSLQKSGYTEVYSFARDFWKDLARRGAHAIPPGFIARLMGRFMALPVGLKDPSATEFKEEDALLARIFNAEGADRLEGIFLLSGADRDPAIAQGIFQQIIDRLPAFQDNDIAFSDTDLEKSFSVEHSASAGFDVDQALEKIYIKALDELATIEFRFYADDIFEIGHPNLFERPADHLFYRRMSRAMKGMAFWTRSVFTLKEESSWIVARYGEPQVLPLGGYDELTNKGNISSIVPSELAYIDESMQFDLFDYKFIENQLTYFKRDSGAVFRIRRDIIIKITLTEFFEHERHLGLLFAWFFNLAEKLIDTFVKDMVNVIVILNGYRPSSLKDAYEFFEHFLREKMLDKRIKILSEETPEKLESTLRQNAQNWLFAATPEQSGNFVRLEFPQSDEFAAMPPDDQEKELGMLINNAIERMVKNADSQI
ncbi:MAG: hypothetical protein EOM80_07900 [Erysipelotrichia bacterium]|nr:hypothetical protein [Erysipelotrichia bacterium]